MAASTAAASVRSTLFHSTPRAAWPSGEAVRSQPIRRAPAPRSRCSLSTSRLPTKPEAPVTRIVIGPESSADCRTMAGEVGFDHLDDHRLEADRRLPAELLLRLARVAEQDFDLGGPAEARIDHDVGVGVEPE